jgi:hypothetical protein
MVFKPSTRKLYMLVLNVPASVAKSEDRFDFEPLSAWIKQDDGSYNVQQRVYLDGGRVFGEQDVFQEQLSDIVRDFDRFVSLAPHKP